jgi:superfamily I DNA/RNA helicase
MEHAPSAQQQSIFDWFASGTGNLVVQARAGTGKTTTILAAVRRAPEKRIMLCAFNKLIADELTSRVADLRPRVEAKTLHSLGFDCLKRAWRGVRVDADRGGRLARAAAGGDADRKAVGVIATGRCVAPRRRPWHQARAAA